MPIYKEILFSFILRDNDFPAVKNSKGYGLKGALKTIYTSVNTDIIDFFTGNNRILENKIWLYAESVNQLRAIDFLTQMDNTIIVTESKKLTALYPEKKIHRLVHKRRIFKRLSWFKRSKYYKMLFKIKFKDHFNSIFKYDGIYESFLTITKMYPPIVVIMSNDHNAVCRALLFAGKTNNFKTIYLQHAAVTRLFPPLVFDLSLLEGEDSLNKYRLAGPLKGNIKLIGMPKFDAHFEHINASKKIKKIGIALNNGDDFIKYFNLSDLIVEQYPDIQVIYRFHPSINTDSLLIPTYSKLSDTKFETSFEYLKNVDALIAGNSSIHLEATLMNVVSIYIGFNQNPNQDYYGFLKNGLVREIQSNEILNWLKKMTTLKPDVRYKAKYYVDTIGSEWDGKSTILVTKLIQNFIQN